MYSVYLHVDYPLYKLHACKYLIANLCPDPLTASTHGHLLSMYVPMGTCSVYPWTLVQYIHGHLLSILYAPMATCSVYRMCPRTLAQYIHGHLLCISMGTCSEYLKWHKGSVLHEVHPFLCSVPPPSPQPTSCMSTVAGMGRWPTTLFTSWTPPPWAGRKWCPTTPQRPP